ncbi:hypothetical protein ACVIKP_005067 [Rhizobium leguminosarum]
MGDGNSKGVPKTTVTVGDRSGSRLSGVRLFGIDSRIGAGPTVRPMKPSVGVPEAKVTATLSFEAPSVRAKAKAPWLQDTVTLSPSETGVVCGHARLVGGNQAKCNFTFDRRVAGRCGVCRGFRHRSVSLLTLWLLSCVVVILCRPGEGVCGWVFQKHGRAFQRVGAILASTEPGHPMCE